MRSFPQPVASGRSAAARTIKKQSLRSLTLHSPGRAERVWPADEEPKISAVHPTDAACPPTSAELGSLTSRVLAFLSSGGRVAVIAGSDPAALTVLLAAVTAGAGGAAARIANPLMTPLNLTRILVQADVFDDGEDDAALLGLHWAKLASPTRPALVSVDDAHTLDAEALTTLVGLALRADEQAPVQLLLAGRPELEARVANLTIDDVRDTGRVLVLALPPGNALTPALSQRQGLELAQPIAAQQTDPMLPPPPPPLRVSTSAQKLVVTTVAADPAGRNQYHLAQRVRLKRVPVLIAALVAFIGAAAAIRYEAGLASVRTESVASPIPAPDEAPAPLPAPAQTSVAADPAPQPVLLPPPAERAAPEHTEGFLPGAMSRSDEQIRLDFAAFLNRTGRATIIDDPKRFEDLFQGYLRWRSRTQAEPSRR